MSNILGFNQRDIKRMYNYQNKSIREPVSAETRRQVLHNAGNKCQYSEGCSIREGGDIRLDIHHIDMVNSHNNTSNLMALCKTHHGVMHRKYKIIHKTGICGERISSRVVKAGQKPKRARTTRTKPPSLFGGYSGLGSLTG